MNKKLIGLVLLLSLSVGLGACNNEEPAGDTTATPTETPAPATTP